MPENKSEVDEVIADVLDTPNPEVVGAGGHPDHEASKEHKHSKSLEKKLGDFKDKVFEGDAKELASNALAILGDDRKTDDEKIAAIQDFGKSFKALSSLMDSASSVSENPEYKDAGYKEKALATALAACGQDVKPETVMAQAQNLDDSAKVLASGLKTTAKSAAQGSTGHEALGNAAEGIALTAGELTESVSNIVTPLAAEYGSKGIAKGFKGLAPTVGSAVGGGIGIAADAIMGAISKDSKTDFAKTGSEQGKNIGKLVGDKLEQPVQQISGKVIEKGTELGANLTGDLLKKGSSDIGKGVTSLSEKATGKAKSAASSLSDFVVSKVEPLKNEIQGKVAKAGPKASKPE